MFMKRHICQTIGNGNPLQYSCLENPRDGGAWGAAVYGVAQSRTRLKRLSSMTTGKTIALTRQTFVGKVMSLLFNTLSRFIMVFLPKRKCLFISRLQSLSAVILEPKKMKFVISSTWKKEKNVFSLGKNKWL